LEVDDDEPGACSCGVDVLHGRGTMRLKVRFHLAPIAEAAFPVRLGRQCWNRAFVGAFIMSRLPGSNTIATVSGTSSELRARSWNSRALPSETDAIGAAGSRSRSSSECHEMYSPA
ncbi:MAG TPA: hypothetical protein PLU79_23010, partial [Burkholderiaceae bacterium]|nr:hypothetical protein [Burkholderiaceae bacterium]